MTEQPKTLVVIVHPNINTSIANKAWKEELEKYPDKFRLHELYKIYPDGKIDSDKEHQLLEQYQNIVFQFPLYWYSSPYLLKKWLDEVFTYGWAYGSTGNKLKGKNIALAITLGGEASYYTKENAGYTLDEIVTPFKMTAKFIQGNYFGCHAMFAMTHNATPKELKDNTQEYIAFLLSLDSKGNNW